MPEQIGGIRVFTFVANERDVEGIPAKGQEQQRKTCQAQPGSGVGFEQTGGGLFLRSRWRRHWLALIVNIRFVRGGRLKWLNGLKKLNRLNWQTKAFIYLCRCIILPEHETATDQDSAGVAFFGLPPFGQRAFR